MKKKPVAAALLALGAAAAFAQAPDPNQLRSWAAACSNCHGTNGVAQAGMDTLAGQSASELSRKLIEFKEGKRPATIMHQIAKGYSDDQLRQLAGWFAAQKK